MKVNSENSAYYASKLGKYATNLLKHGHPLLVEVKAVTVHWRRATGNFLAKKNTIIL